MEERGYLEVIVGPMFSGKTSRLTEIYKQCLFCDIRVLAINHSCDTRYTQLDEQSLATHDLVKIPCTNVARLQDTTRSLVEAAEVVLINEGQFFEDLVPFVRQLLAAGKKVHVCGLDGDFERNVFGTILELIPLADDVVKLKSLCSKCRDGTPAIFSKRLSAEKQQTLVGSSNYIPVCRRCYFS